MGVDQPADGAGSATCRMRALFLGFNALRDPRIEVELRDLLAPAAAAAAALKGKKTGGSKKKSSAKAKAKAKARARKRERAARKARKK